MKYVILNNVVCNRTNYIQLESIKFRQNILQFTIRCLIARFKTTFDVLWYHIYVPEGSLDSKLQHFPHHISSVILVLHLHI